MQSNTLGRCAILLIFTTSMILAFWEFATMYRYMQLSRSEALSSSSTTEYSFHRTTAINNRLTKTVRVDRWIDGHSKIGICTLARDHKPATQTTLMQAEYPAFFVSQPLLDGLWSREAALLEVLKQSISDPRHHKLEWLVWIDTNSPLLEKQIPLEDLLPPSDLERPVHLMYARDILMIKVSSWSIEFLSAVVKRQAHRTEDEFGDPDRWVLEDVMRSDDFKYESIDLPSWWFDICSDESQWGMPSKREERVRAFWEDYDIKRRIPKIDATMLNDPRRRLWD